MISANRTHFSLINILLELNISHGVGTTLRQNTVFVSRWYYLYCIAEVNCCTTSIINWQLRPPNAVSVEKTAMGLKVNSLSKVRNTSFIFVWESNNRYLSKNMPVFLAKACVGETQTNWPKHTGVRGNMHAKQGGLFVWSECETTNVRLMMWNWSAKFGNLRHPLWLFLSWDLRT